MKARIRAGIVLLALVLGACGARAALVEHAGQGLTVTLGTVNAARDQFTAWDAVHQKEILDSHVDRASYDVAIKAYRAKQAAVLAAFTATYGVIGTAAAALPLVEADKLSTSELVTDLLQVASAVKDMQAAIKALDEGGSP